MNVIFLDIDGVLNCTTTQDKCGNYVGIEDAKLSELKRIVEKTGAKIVLISTWKQDWEKGKNRGFMADYLDEKFEAQGLFVYDKTKNKTEGIYLSRGEGIIDYIISHNLQNYVILDDCQFDYDSCNITDKFVKTDLETGLTKALADKAIEILSGKK